MMLKGKRICLLVLLSIIVVGVRGSDVSSLYGNNRKLVDSDLKTSPSPSPVTSLKSNDPIKVDKPRSLPKDGSVGSLTNERCSKLPIIACRDKGNLIACLQYSGEAPRELFLLVQNDGDSSLKVNGTMEPKISFNDVQISKKQAIKINMTSYLSKSISIVLDAGNDSCTLSMAAPATQDGFFKYILSYAAQVTLVHGAYLLSLTVLIIGGMWAWCKWGRRGRSTDGIPYQELEMGNHESVPDNNVETADGWDDGWDNDWDDGDAVRTPSRNHEANGSVNGFNSRALKREGRGKEWDD